MEELIKKIEMLAEEQNIPIEVVKFPIPNKEGNTIMITINGKTS